MDQESIEISYQRDPQVLEIHRDFNSVNATHAQLATRNRLLENAFINRKKKEENKLDLKTILKNAKVKVLTKNFVKKLKRNSIHRSVAEYLIASDEQDNAISNGWQQKLSKLGETPGIALGNIGLAIWSFTNIIQITSMVFIFSILLTFPETQDNEIFLYFRISSVILYIIDMIFNFITKRYESEKRLQTLGDISHFYLRNGFWIDLVSILIFPIQLLVDSSVTIVISFVAIIKLINNLNKFEKFEYLYINTSEKQQYYGLIKVFITNFAIGHFLSIFLNLMALINTDENWVIKLEIQNQQWFIKYIWGYYWGTNIMLTVGFGDISATNFYEAIILIFIETFSCITLAYNISYVGAIIGSIRDQNAYKKKKLKTLHRMCKENEVSTDVQSKLSNFIEEFYRIKETFSYDDEDQVINFLPKSMQLEYRKQSNKILFQNLGFLSNMSHKTLLRLAESVTRKICHPEQLIIKRGTVSDFIILQKGELSLGCRIRSKLDGKVIQMIAVEDATKPRIYSLDFIKNKISNYNVKSTTYSVLYCLSRQEFMGSLRGSEIDFQLFCVLRDRDEYIIDENNLYLCEVCQGQYHNKFECPRLHYFPIKQTIIFKNLETVKKKKQSQQPFDRANKKFNAFEGHDKVKEDQRYFIKNHYDEEQYEKMENLISFYENINRGRKLKEVGPNTLQFDKKIDQRIRMKTARIYQEKAINMIEELYNANTKETSFWELQCDEAHNFRYYFEKGNPVNICKNRKTNRTY